MKIIGAGLSGLIAGHIFPSAEILEARPEPFERHRALLRFRSPRIGQLTGIDFRRVRVRKAIWSQNKFAAPSIKLANLYAQKVTGRVIDRSIWNLDAVDRYIAPPDFYWRMVDALRPRIRWFERYKFEPRSEPVISTIPMHITLHHCDIETTNGIRFESKNIHVTRAKVRAPCDIFQTVYFPDLASYFYRVSISGNVVIAESIRPDAPPDNYAVMLQTALEAVTTEVFGIRSDIEFEEVDKGHSQRFGKIAPIEDEARRALIAELTDAHNVYSLGRFATWRNILLDDLVNDAGVIRRIMQQTKYQRSITRSANGRF